MVSFSVSRFQGNTVCGASAAVGIGIKILYIGKFMYDCEYSQTCSGMDFKLGAYVLAVSGHRMHRQAECIGNLLV